MKRFGGDVLGVQRDPAAGLDIIGTDGREVQRAMSLAAHQFHTGVIEQHRAQRADADRALQRAQTGTAARALIGQAPPDDRATSQDHEPYEEGLGNEGGAAGRGEGSGPAEPQIASARATGRDTAFAQ